MRSGGLPKDANAAMASTAHGSLSGGHHPPIVTCCFKGPKFRYTRSTPMARVSSSDKCLERFANKEAYAPLLAKGSKWRARRLLGNLPLTIIERPSGARVEQDAVSDFRARTGRRFTNDSLRNRGLAT